MLTLLCIKFIHYIFWMYTLVFGVYYDSLQSLVFFIYFWLCWVFVAAWTFLYAEQRAGGCSLLWCRGFSSWCLLLWSAGSRQVCFSSRGTWAQELLFPGSGAPAQQLWCVGLVAPGHMGSSQTRDETRVSCIGRQILYH